MTPPNDAFASVQRALARGLWVQGQSAPGVCLHAAGCMSTIGSKA